MQVVEAHTHDGMRTAEEVEVKIRFAKHVYVEGDGSLDRQIAEDINKWEEERAAALVDSHNSVLDELRKFSTRWVPSRGSSLRDLPQSESLEDCSRASQTWI